MKEQIPNWLKLLLAKYGEEQGPLIGIEASVSDEAAEVSYQGEVDSSQVSNLLEQMAEEPTPLSSERISTSVEWGAPPAEEPANPIDALLANFDADADTHQPTYETAPSEPATVAEDDDVPDWLSDALEASPTEMPQAASQATPSTPFEDDDVPDWLSAALEESVADAPEQSSASTLADDDQPDWLSAPASQPHIVSPESEDAFTADIPDWLSHTIPSGPVVDDTSTASVDDDFDGPDWLSQETAAPSPPIGSSSTTDRSDFDVPDWIAETIEDTPKIEEKPISGGEIPDWIGSPSAFEEENLSEIRPDQTKIPDWLVSADEDVDANETQAQAEPPASTTAEPAGSMSWLSDLRAGMADDLSDEVDEPEAWAESFDEDESPELPAWLMDEPMSAAAQETPASQEFLEPIVSEAADIPDWLTDEPPDAEPTIPDWLSGKMPTADATTELEPEIPAWLMDVEPAQTQDKSEPEQEDGETPNWLTDLQATETDEGEAPSEPELPDWLAGISPEIEDSPGQPETMAPLPDWLAEETPEDTIPSPVSTEQQAEDVVLPSWLAGLRQTGAEMSPDLPDDEPTDDLEASDWLADLPGTAVENVAGAEPELPDWLAGVETMDEESSATDEAAEIPDWLTDLPETESSLSTMPNEDEEPQTPDWLTESTEDDTEAASLADDSPEFPDWLADLSEPAETVTDDKSMSQMEPETSDWLSNLRPTETTPEDEADDWLADLREPELETPDWMTELSTVTSAEKDEPSAFEEEEDDEEASMPTWLVDVSTTDQVETDLEMASPSLEQVEASSEAPDWLSNLRGGGTIEAAPADAAETLDEEPEAPDWLADEIDPLVTEETPLDEGPELPSWLAGLPSMEAEDSSPESIELPTLLSAEPIPDDKAASEGGPDWLTELSDEPGESPQIQALESDLPDWLAELPQTADTGQLSEAEIPEWLSELPQAPNTGQLENSEAFRAIEREMPSAQEDIYKGADDETTAPSWLTELTPDEDNEADVKYRDEDTTDAPSWLSELQASDAETSAPKPDEEDLTEAPDWLSEMSKTATEEEPDVSAQSDGPPSWLTDLPEAPDTGFLESQTWAADETAETPDWLRDLPEATDNRELENVDATSAEPAAPLDQSEDKVEAPHGLAELPNETETLPAFDEAEEDEADDDAPSWLTGLHQTDRETSFDNAEQIETSDWLAELPDAAETDEDELAGESDEEIAGELPDEIEAPDWLTGLRRAEAGALLDTQTDEASDESLDDVEAPDWLTDLPSAEEISPAEDDVEAPSWLTETTDIPEETSPSEDDLETPDWLADVPTDAYEETSPTEDDLETPDWLTDVTADAQTEETDLTETETDAEPETLDWLAGVTTDAQPEVVEELDWLADLTGDDEATPEVEMMAEDSTPDIGASIWLAELQDASGVEAADTPDTPEIEALDWLTKLSTEAVEPETTTETSPVEAVEAPDWLADFGPESPADESAETPVQDLFASEPATPDWLADLDAEIPDLPDSAESITSVEAPAEAVDAEAEEDTPDWLSTSVSAETVVDEETPSPDEFEPPDWLTEEATESLSIEPTTLTTESVDEAEPPIPDWLDEATQDASPLTARDLPDTAETEAVVTSQGDEDKTPPPPAWMMGLREATEAVKSALPDKEADTFETFITSDDAIKPSLAEESGLDLDIDEPPTETPDWLKDLDESADDLALSFEPDTVEEDEGIDLPSTAPLSPRASEKSGATANVPSWLQGLRPSESKDSEAAEPDETTESTGVLTGLTALMPAEKLETPTVISDASFLSNRPEALRAAAQQFYAIATQVPQPAVLPETLTQPKLFAINLPRLIVYLLFILLIALPLLPGLRAEDRGRSATWTEPVGSLSEELDTQRRQMISEPLGIIDQQPPGAVALVSFDFSAATQGEMKPLAEAIIGRLKGQGMRLIFISLEPEGSSLAQQMIDQLLAERDEIYGEAVVNLGYIPGQVAGIRTLLSGENVLATHPDIQGLTLGSADRAAWADIRSLDQVNLIVTIADNPASARWWIEQLALAPEPVGQDRFLLAATSALAAPFLHPYQINDQIDGVIAGINGAAAIEAGRRDFGLARQMLDSQSIAHLLMVIIMAAGTIAGWMPPLNADETPPKKSAQAPQTESKEE